MKPQNNKQTVNELLNELSIDDQQAREIAHDIQLGDDLLGRYGQVEMRPGTLLRVEQTINRQLGQSRVAKRVGWVKRLAVAAIVLILLSVTAIMMVNKTDEQTLFDDEQILWEMAFSHEYDEYEIDDIALTEVLLFLDEPKTDSENIIGKKILQESYV